MEVLVVSLLIAVVGIPFGMLAWLRHARTEAYGEALVRAGGDVLIEDSFANNFGLTSLGRTQARGNGALVLGTEALVFVQIAPRRPLVIPLSAITRVESTRTHLGKATPAELVRVHFDDEGNADSVAFACREPARWFSELERALERQAEGRDLDERVTEAGSRASSAASKSLRQPAERG